MWASPLRSSRSGRCLQYLFQSRLHRASDSAAPVRSESYRRHEQHGGDLYAQRDVDRRLGRRSIASSSDYDDTAVAVAFVLELMYGWRHVLARRLSCGHSGSEVSPNKSVSERKDDLIRPNLDLPGRLETFTLQKWQHHAGESPLSQASYDSQAKRHALDGTIVF
jgi:hypothetical protein